MKTQELSSGIKIRAFKTPPANFSALKADDKELIVYGIPARPVHDERMLERWKTMFNRPLNLIHPTFREMTYKRRKLPKRTSKATHGTETTDIWSGVVVHAPAGDSFRWVEGTFTVPNAYPPMHAQNGVWYSASAWVGIDGIDGSGDVLQAGCDSDVMKQNGSIQRQLNPWWEWYPAGSFWISNLTISQGDTINVLICVDSGSTTEALIFIYNLTSNIGTNFQATAPTGTNLQGNSAEWIIERLEIDTNTPELARYGEVYFDETNAGTLNKAVLQGGSGDVVLMVDNGNTISAGSIKSAQVLQVKYTGPNS